MPNQSYERARRTKVAKRQGWLCYYCGQPMNKTGGRHENPTGVTLEHLIPRSQGGTSGWDNIVAACYSCNRGRGTRPIDRGDVA